MPFTAEELAAMAAADAEIEREFELTADEYKLSQQIDEEAIIARLTQSQQEKRKQRTVNKEKIAKWQHKYRETHRDKLAEYNRLYYAAHKNEIAARKHEYYIANKERILKHQRGYYAANKEQILARERGREENEGLRGNDSSD